MAVANRAATVELELSSYDPDSHFKSPHTKAAVVRDGTIQADAGAIVSGEWVVGPITASAHPAAMSELGKWLSRHDHRGNVWCRVNPSCGLHVHVDARDYGTYELRRLIQLYRVLEPHFYSLVHPSRSANEHCHPYTQDDWDRFTGMAGEKDMTRVKEIITEAIYPNSTKGLHEQKAIAERIAELKGQRGNNHRIPARYFGLNIHSFFYRGTFEFRMHEGSVDVKEISDWMQWCRWFVEMGSRLRDREVREIRTVDDYLLGAWKRPWGVLSLPKEIVNFARRVREFAPFKIAQPTVRIDRAAYANILQQAQVANGAQNNLDFMATPTPPRNR